MKRLLPILILGVFLTTLSQNTYAQNTISIENLKDYVWLSNPVFSPDGEKVAFIKRTANFEDNKYEKTLYTYDIKSNQLQEINTNLTGIRSLNWTPQNEITLLARGSNKTTQVFKIPTLGGKAQQITNHETSIITYALSPGENTIALVSKDKKQEKTGENRHLKSFKVGYDWYLAKEPARSNHLWLYDIQNNTTKKLTSGEESYCTLSGGISWSPNGKKILYSTQPKPHSSEYLKSKLQTINIDTGKITNIEGSQPVPRNPKYANDGTIFYSKSRGKEFYFTPNGIYSGNKLVFDIDRNIRHYNFLPNNELLVSGTDGTEISFWYGKPYKKTQKLDLKGLYPSLGNVTTNKNGNIVFVGTTSQSAPELYFMKSVNSKPKKLTSFNEKISNLNLGKVENINWTSTDEHKFYEDGVITYPPNYKKGKKYPLVLFIHGGPMGWSSETFGLSAQSFAAQGWIVFQPNYRGSSNLGFEYQRSVINDAGFGPGKDVMAGIEKLKSMNIIDENNIAVSGWSYGGFMTVWLTSHYQGWKSAVAGAAVTDWFDWYTMADWNVWSGKGLGGSPWLNNNAENYRKQSPITYAHQIKTPTLILSNTLDPRVTVSQSFKLFSNLKDNGVETEFIAYPLPGHFPGDPIHRRDVYRRWTVWIKKHFD